MHRILIISCAGLLALVAGCGNDTDTAGRDLEMTSSAEIVAVDRENRTVRLRTAEGESYEIVAGPGIRNFDQIEVGDAVVATYMQSVDLALANDAPADEAGSVSGQTASASEGMRPGTADALSANVIVEFIDYNEDTGVATFAGPQGRVHRAQVHPEFRDFASARKSGDRVRVTATRLVAVTVEEQ